MAEIKCKIYNSEDATNVQCEMNGSGMELLLGVMTIIRDLAKNMNTTPDTLCEMLAFAAKNSDKFAVKM